MENSFQELLSGILSKNPHIRIESIIKIANQDNPIVCNEIKNAAFDKEWAVRLFVARIFEKSGAIKDIDFLNKWILSEQVKKAHPSEKKLIVCAIELAIFQIRDREITSLKSNE